MGSSRKRTWLGVSSASAAIESRRRSPPDSRPTTYVDVTHIRGRSHNPHCGTQPPGLTCNTARNNCSYLCSSELGGTLPFPHSWTTPWLGNGAAAVLLPDNETLVQMQPLVRCTPGSPIFALDWRNFIPATGSASEDSPGAANRSPLPLPGLPTSNTSILSEGTWGGHGGSRLSSIGGTIRRGELLPDAPPIPHAIKLQLFGQSYYWAGNATAGNECYRWPALNCDCWSIPSRRKSMSASNANAYLGSNPALKLGSLLAVPAALSTALKPRIRSAVGQKMLDVLTDYVSSVQ